MSFAHPRRHASCAADARHGAFLRSTAPFFEYCMGLAKPNFQIQPGTVPLYPLCAVSTVSWNTASFTGRGGSHTRLHAASIKGHLEVVPSPFKTVQILNLVTLKARLFECSSPILGQDVDFSGYLSRLDPSACCTARYVHRDIARLLLLGSRGAE